MKGSNRGRKQLPKTIKKRVVGTTLLPIEVKLLADEAKARGITVSQLIRYKLFPEVVTQEHPQEIQPSI